MKKAEPFADSASYPSGVTFPAFCIVGFKEGFGCCGFFYGTFNHLTSSPYGILFNEEPYAIILVVYIAAEIFVLDRFKCENVSLFKKFKRFERMNIPLFAISISIN